ncbi:MAG: SRPBCC family protein [Bdellovibrionales bacterium]|nr:SRPBCC family protein [Bdellovibrionales bacterium]
MNIVKYAFLLIICPIGAVWASSDCLLPKEKEKFEKPNYIYSAVINKSNQLEIDLCGQVSAPKEFVLKRLTDFKRYKEINSFVKSVEVKGSEISVKVSFLGYEMNSKIVWKQVRDSELYFDVKTGVFKGMKIKLKVVDLQRRRSMVVMQSIYKYTKLKIPDLILESGINALAKQFARNMQNWLSLEYVKARENQNGGEP